MTDGTRIEDGYREVYERNLPLSSSEVKTNSSNRVYILEVEVS